MTPRLLKCYRADGTARGVWSDATSKGFRAAGAVPRRASNVEVVEAGPHRGEFHVDFSRLAALTGDPAHAICLARTFDSYAEAVRTEVAWLERNWVTGG